MATTRTRATDPAGQDDALHLAASVVTAAAPDVTAILAAWQAKHDAEGVIALSKSQQAEHGLAVLRTVGCLKGDKWAGFPTLANGKPASFIAIAKAIVPNPSELSYRYSQQRAKDLAGPDAEAYTEAHAYSLRVEAVSSALKYAVTRKGSPVTGYVAQSRNKSGSGAADQPSVVEALADAASEGKGQAWETILHLIGDAADRLDKGEGATDTPDRDKALRAVCDHYVKAYDRAMGQKPPSPKPVTRKRTAKVPA